MDKAILTIINISESSRFSEIRDDMQKLHGIISSSFLTKESKKLFQCDLDLNVIRILSKEIPDKVHLYTELEIPKYHIKQYDYSNKLSLIEEGKSFNFFFIGNPVIHRTKLRLPLRTYAEKKDWFYRKARESGFTIENVFLTSSSVKAKNILFNKVTYVGSLKVTDSSLFKQTLLTGIGHAKAYGFGMLWIEGLLESK